METSYVQLFAGSLWCLKCGNFNTLFRLLLRYDVCMYVYIYIGKWCRSISLIIAVRCSYRFLESEILGNTFFDSLKISSFGITFIRIISPSSSKITWIIYSNVLNELTLFSTLYVDSYTNDSSLRITLRVVHSLIKFTLGTFSTVDKTILIAIIEDTTARDEEGITKKGSVDGARLVDHRLTEERRPREDEFAGKKRH